LSSPERRVLIWRYYDHKSIQQIAESLEIEPAQAQALLCQAMASLQRHVHGWDHLL
jgi:DNA-directed RNA polymerase specialized sigma24 family protein